jgi:hypothetical protein
MQDRRLVGIDLGITSAHTVRVLAGDGSLVCRRKAIPTVDSLEQVERAALAGTPAGTLLEVVMEPTGPAGRVAESGVAGPRSSPSRRRPPCAS